MHLKDAATLYHLRNLRHEGLIRYSGKRWLLNTNHDKERAEKIALAEQRGKERVIEAGGFVHGQSPTTSVILPTYKVLLFDSIVGRMNAPIFTEHDLKLMAELRELVAVPTPIPNGGPR